MAASQTLADEKWRRINHTEVSRDYQGSMAPNGLNQLIISISRNHFWAIIPSIPVTGMLHSIPNKLVFIFARLFLLIEFESSKRNENIFDANQNNVGTSNEIVKPFVNYLSVCHKSRGNLATVHHFGAAENQIDSHGTLPERSKSTIRQSYGIEFVVRVH